MLGFIIYSFPGKFQCAYMALLRLFSHKYHDRKIFSGINSCNCTKGLLMLADSGKASACRGI